MNLTPRKKLFVDTASEMFGEGMPHIHESAPVGRICWPKQHVEVWK